MERPRFVAMQLLRFAWIEMRCCAFAVAVFIGLALSKVGSLPVARYDVLLVYCVLVTAAFRLLRWEPAAEMLVVSGFHLVGLVFELVKVSAGSWSYPEPAMTKVLGVPLYSGFLYAAVGSYVVAAWRLFDLRVSGYRALPTAAVAGAIYVNLMTHHWLPDLRWLLAGLLIAVTWKTTVHFTVGSRRYRMPLAVSFTFIGFFLWLAENIATYLGAWRYPHQLEAWRLVDPAKSASWAMLVSVAFVLVARTRRLCQPEPQANSRLPQEPGRVWAEALRRVRPSPCDLAGITPSDAGPISARGRGQVRRGGPWRQRPIRVAAGSGRCGHSSRHVPGTQASVGRHGPPRLDHVPAGGAQGNLLPDTSNNPAIVE